MTIPSFSDAVDSLRGWYYSEIRSIADSAIEACVGRVSALGERAALDAEALGDQVLADSIRIGEWSRERDEGVDPREFMTEYVDQATDGHEFVIYTFKAKLALAISDNESAYEDEIGESGTVEARACMAMRADVWEILNARDDEWDVEDSDDDESDDESEGTGLACHDGPVLTIREMASRSLG